MGWQTDEIHTALLLMHVSVCKINENTNKGELLKMVGAGGRG